MHILGKWHLDDTSGEPHRARVVSESGAIVAELSGSAKTIAATGNLIAAAPDLLIALELARKEIVALTAACGSGLMTDRVLAAAVAAINTATGVAA